MKTFVALAATAIGGVMFGVFGWHKVVRYVNKHDREKLHEILDAEME